ncbi:hypothetical protein [Sphingomonas sp. Leaf34]|uniref:hypothetical protein n=1 Tax=Sphingomonas sp. Leaf34 TaxID=1736216 RepID=UPI0006FA5CB2|nr:hypothetical protein [Sphingomonas sp. Leaf34]
MPAKPIADADKRDIQNLVKNYQAAGKESGGIWTLAECQNELAARSPPKLRKSHADGRTTGDERPVPDEHIEVLRGHVERMRFELTAMKDASVIFGEHPDWPWTGFISSYATYGGSANWTKNIEPRMEEFGWDRVCGLDDGDRAELFYAVPNPLRRSQTLPRIEAVFQSIRKEGGPAKVRDRFAKATSTEAWMNMLRAYPGIGPKYARNFGMDVYHPLVRDHFAVDSRLFDILWELTFSKPLFDRAESILKDLAVRLDIDNWGLDRVLYSQSDVILPELRSLNAIAPPPNVQHEI